MSQAIPDTTNVRSALETLRTLDIPNLAEDLVVFLALAVLLYLIAWLLRTKVRAVEDVNRRHALRKWIRLTYVILLALLAIAMFAGALAGLGALLAILLAGVAVALQDVLKSVAGWLYTSVRNEVQVGSRVEVDGNKGDVVDIGVLKTTLLEVGNLVYGQQSTGRLITVPNSRLLSENVFVSAADNLFVWQEVQVVVTFESDWRKMEAVMREAAQEIYEEIAPAVQAAHHRMERRYAYKHGFDTPIVYMSIVERGVELTVRFLTHVRRRRGTSDRVSRRMMAATEENENLVLAYPTWRIYRTGEGGGRGRAFSADGE